MKKTLLMMVAAAAFSGLASASVTYAVDVSFNGNTPNQITTVTTVINGSNGNTLTLSFTPTEPSGSVNTPSFTTWGSLFLTVANNNFDTFALTGTTLNIKLIDTATGGFVLETGTFSGAFQIGANLTNPQSSGLITWAPQGLQQASNGSLVTFLTDNQDQLGQNFNGSAANSTVNGQVNTVAAPEPATFGLMGAALVGLGFIARKRKA